MKPLKPSKVVRIKSISMLVIVTFFSALFLNLVVLPASTARATVYSVFSDANSGAGSLRQAIIDSNTSGSNNIITFSAGAHTINLTSALPAITTQSVTIDGSANVDINGNPTIEINGASAGSTADGLLFMACCITVKSLIIHGFGGNGINIQGPSSNNNTVINSFIGTGTTGNTAQANSTGIKIQSSSTNIIGGTSSGTRNIISGNTVNGVWVLGPNASGNSVIGNYIGIGLSGTVLPNTDGVKLDGATNSKIGNFTTTIARNIISGNTSNGVLLTGSLTTGNQVMGNYIGTNIAGDASIKNATGVRVDGAPSNIIGGSISGMGNLISGNQNGYGVLLINSGATGNAVEGNFIGTTASGDASLRNGAGVGIIGAHTNTIGGSTLLTRNVISGNTNGSGIEIYGSQSTTNKVIGNYIGTNAGGTLALPNVNGIEVGIDATNNLIGDIGTTDGNVISGNSGSGIHLIAGNLSNTATNNIIRHNIIGVTKDGTVALPNLKGIFIEGVSSNTIGGTINPPGNRNIISGNTQAGISITNNNTFVAQDNLVQGNFIGLSLSGLVGIPNADGIVLTGASGTLIGKADANSSNNYRNYITSNTNSGLSVTGTSTAANVSIGNLFGYKGDNTLFPGGGKGITVGSGGRLQLTGRNQVA